MFTGVFAFQACLAPFLFKCGKVRVSALRLPKHCRNICRNAETRTAAGAQRAALGRVGRCSGDHFWVKPLARLAPIWRRSPPTPALHPCFMPLGCQFQQSRHRAAPFTPVSTKGQGGLSRPRDCLSCAVARACARGAFPFGPRCDCRQLMCLLLARARGVSVRLSPPGAYGGQRDSRNTAGVGVLRAGVSRARALVCLARARRCDGTPRAPLPRLYGGFGTPARRRGGGGNGGHYVFPRHVALLHRKRPGAGCHGSGFVCGVDNGDGRGGIKGGAFGEEWGCAPWWTGARNRGESQVG